MRRRARSRLLAACALVAAPCVGLAEILSNKPFQVVRPTANHTSLIPVADGLHQLANHDRPIAVVSVVGPYHSGKSFLLNSLVGEPSVFQIGRQTDPQTMGIWLCRTDMKASDGSEVWLMDSEGFFGPGVGENYDAKIFTIATLLGAHLVYNTVKVIDQQAVDLLEMLARRAQLFRTRSSAEALGVQTPEFLSSRNFPPLTWVVEDFVQELPYQYRHQGGVTAWLKSYLTKTNTSDGEQVHYLTRLYSGLNVHTLFLPATEKMQLQDLSRVPWQGLTNEFRSEVQALRSNILRDLKGRKFEGRPMTGRTFERTLRFIVQALQRGMFHDLPSMWATWGRQVAEMSLQDADSWFAALLTMIDVSENPIPLREFNAQIEQARVRSIEFYKNLLRDFEVNLNVNELRNRMNAHFGHKVMFYHERIQRWVGDVIARHKDEFSKMLSALELPMDPTILQKKAQNSTSYATAVFAQRLKDFSADGARVHHGRAAQMPAFSQDPTAQLASDLRTLQGMRELENGREVEAFFKAAATAADEAVELELKHSSNRLVGKARMQELAQVVEMKCWNAFDEVLRRHKWMMMISHYKTHKALTQTESLEGRLARFQAANEQRLTTHFRTALERVVGSYRVKQQTIALPISEKELEAEHRQLASAMRESLEEQGSELTDTDPYRMAWGQLKTSLEEGFQDIRQKNIDLWTVHSNEARKCALRLNQMLERQCGLLCLFNKVPQVHKQTSKRHLFDCFVSSQSNAVRMSPQMQEEVFENWYMKDLARDASTVWNHFYITSALVGFFVLCMCSCCSRPYRHPPYFHSGASATSGYGGGRYGSAGLAGPGFGPTGMSSGSTGGNLFGPYGGGAYGGGASGSSFGMSSGMSGGTGSLWGSR